MKVTDFRLRKDFRALLACNSHENDSRTGRSKWEWIQGLHVATHLFSTFLRALATMVTNFFSLKLGSLCNRTAGRLRTPERRKNVARDSAFPILRDIFSSFCRPECSSRPIA